MQMLVRYTNSLGEVCVEPLLGEFYAKDGTPMVVTHCWRENAPICLTRDEAHVYSGRIEQ